MEDGRQASDPASGAEAVVEFLLRLRARGIRDLRVLRAMETVPRKNFVPHLLGDLAYRDIALPIACGQIMPEPFAVARMLEAFAVEPHHRVLEIGAGSGYTTALLARLASEVLSCDRFQTLVTSAQTRLASLKLASARVFWKDGLDLDLPAAHFDRILVHALVDDLPANWLNALSAQGILMAGSAGAGGQGGQLVAHRRQPDGSFAATQVCPCRLHRLMPGLARGL